MEDDKTKSTLVVKSKEGETISTSVKESTEVEREEEENSKAMEDDTEVAKSKSKLFTYLLWFFLGWAGIHHFYLGRYRQGVLWLTSFGGLFGIGWLGDIVRLPTYVHHSNKNHFLERLEQKKKNGPPVSDNLHRIVSQVMFGVFYRGLIYCAIPWDSPVMNYAAIILPLGTAFGTYMVSNVGKQKSSFWWSLLGAIIGDVFAGFLPLSKPLSAAAFSMIFSTYGWKWREKQEDVSFGVLLFVASFSFIVCLILSGSFIYCNASIKANDGGIVKFHDVFDKFFNSGNITELYKIGGRGAIFERLIDIADFDGKYRAFEVLGLDPETEFEDVTKRYKQLVGDRDPDHYEDENNEIQEEIMQYNNAYEVLKKAYRWKKFYDSFSDLSSA